VYESLIRTVGSKATFLRQIIRRDVIIHAAIVGSLEHLIQLPRRLVVGVNNFPLQHLHLPQQRELLPEKSLILSRKVQYRWQDISSSCAHSNFFLPLFPFFFLPVFTSRQLTYHKYFFINFNSCTIVLTLTDHPLVRLLQYAESHDRPPSCCPLRINVKVSYLEA